MKDITFLRTGRLPQRVREDEAERERRDVNEQSSRPGGGDVSRKLFPAIEHGAQVVTGQSADERQADQRSDREAKLGPGHGDVVAQEPDVAEGVGTQDVLAGDEE